MGKDKAGGTGGGGPAWGQRGAALGRQRKDKDSRVTSWGHTVWGHTVWGHTARALGAGSGGDEPALTGHLAGVTLGS